MHIFVQVYRGLKPCTSLLSKFPSFSPQRSWGILIVLYRSSCSCAYAANVVAKDLDIFATGAVSLNDIYTQNC
jgi:hypothetical protein